MSKLISVNIEGDKHLNQRLFPFFKHEKPDVVCMQEVFEQDLELIKQNLDLSDYFFVPLANVNKENIHMNVKGNWGIAIFADQIMSKNAHYYVGNQHTIPAFFENDNPNSMNRVLQVAKINLHKEIMIANTHFTWSGDGTITPEQLKSFKKLESYLDQYPELILCGDFNTPRGGEIFDALAMRFKDNIPADITTTIDKKLHKSGKDIQLVVDGMFSSANYVIKNVRVVDNTSDHKAVVGNVAEAVGFEPTNLKKGQD